MVDCLFQSTDLGQYLEKHTGGLNPRNVKVWLTLPLYIHHVHKIVSQKFSLTVTLKVVNKFPSNLAHVINN